MCACVCVPVQEVSAQFLRGSLVVSKFCVMSHLYFTSWQLFSLSGNVKEHEFTQGRVWISGLCYIVLKNTHRFKLFFIVSWHLVRRLLRFHRRPWNSAFTDQHHINRVWLLTAGCFALRRYSILSPTANFLPADAPVITAHLQVIKSWLGCDCALIRALVLQDDAHLPWLL